MKYIAKNIIDIETGYIVIFCFEVSWIIKNWQGQGKKRIVRATRMTILVYTFVIRNVYICELKYLISKKNAVL